MRIIGGERKGHKLVEWREPGIRPLRDRVRAALFDALGELVRDAEFLDLFAGTGAVGLEALSRGARWATFVDASPQAVRIIRENVRKLRYLDRVEILRADALDAIRRFQREGRCFDIIFIGAPYASGLARRALELLGESPLLREGGVIIAEVGRKDDIGRSYGKLEAFRERDYGDTRLIFFHERG